MKEIKLLPPFKNYVLENFPFIEEDFDALTNYELLCHVVNYVKDMGSQFNDVVLNFIELKNFVDNFFDNLDVQDEINNKLDEMVEDGTLEEIISRYIEKKLPYYLVNNEKTEEEIINIIEKDEPKVVKFETDTYTFSNNISIPSNTKLLLNNSTLKTDNDSIILFYKSSDTFTSYEGVHDVQILNGNLAISSALMHNSNITFNNINFSKTLKTHAIQIAGSKNIVVKNCTFNGIVLNDTIGNNTEMIQLETCTSGGQPYIPSDSPMFNHLGNYNVIIEDCIFNAGDGVNSKFYVGIGHHSRDDENIYCNENIIIRNNKFTNATYSFLSLYGFTNSLIENNEFIITNDYGSDNSSIRFRGANKYVDIKGNIFNGFKFGINYVNIGQCNDFNIYLNKFIPAVYSSNVAIILKAIQNCNIYNNTFEISNKCIQIIPQTNLTTQNIIINSNNFINRSGHGNTIEVSANSKDVKVINNYCKQIENVNFVSYTPGSYESTNPLYYANNYIENNTTLPNDLNRNNSTNFQYIYNSLNAIYTAPNSQYVAIEDRNPGQSFGYFNKAIITLCLHNNASAIFTREIKALTPFDKLSTATVRRYYFDVIDNTNTHHNATFLINADGTFSFTSDGSVVLYNLLCYNELVY